MQIYDSHRDKHQHQAHPLRTLKNGWGYEVSTAVKKTQQLCFLSKMDHQQWRQQCEVTGFHNRFIQLTDGKLCSLSKHPKYVSVQHEMQHCERAYKMLLTRELSAHLTVQFSTGCTVSPPQSSSHLHSIFSLCNHCKDYGRNET